MALTRKFLKALGLEDDKIEEIIANHTETVDALKEQRDAYKADADKLPGVQKQLDDAVAAGAAAEKDPYKVKYDTLKGDFDAYKAEVAGKQTRSEKETAYKALLKELRISERLHDKLVKLADLDAMELADGKIKDADKLSEALKTEWADFVVTKGTEGARVDKPPKGGGDVDTTKMTDAEYYAYQRDQKKG